MRFVLVAILVIFLSTACDAQYYMYSVGPANGNRGSLAAAISLCAASPNNATLNCQYAYPFLSFGRTLSWSGLYNFYFANPAANPLLNGDVSLYGPTGTLIIPRYGDLWKSTGAVLTNALDTAGVAPTTFYYTDVFYSTGNIMTPSPTETQSTNCNNWTTSAAPPNGYFTSTSGLLSPGGSATSFSTPCSTNLIFLCFCIPQVATLTPTTASPTTANPTSQPSKSPSQAPTFTAPSKSPTHHPSHSPSKAPATSSPSRSPTGGIPCTPARQDNSYP